MLSFGMKSEGGCSVTTSGEAPFLGGEEMLIDTFEAAIAEHFGALPETKRAELQELDSRIRQLQPGCRIWFDDGRDEDGKVVTNPTIGYGHQIIHYVKGKTREFFRIGLCGTKTGISVYVLGLKDKKSLAENFAQSIGKARVTGYCIKFKALKDINLKGLEEAIQFGFSQS